MMLGLGANLMLKNGGGAAAWSPASIAGLKLWLDASQIVGLNDGDAVATWSDLSGNANNASQSTASKRPTYRINSINGLPTVDGDGVDDALDFTTPLTNTSYTIFAVINRSLNAQSILAGAKSSGDGYAGIYGNLGAVVVHTGGWTTFLSPMNPTGNMVLTFDIVVGVSAVFALDGAVSAFPLIPAGSPNFQQLLARNSGGTEYFNGKLGEFLFYTPALSLANRQTVEAYLRNKWGTP